MCHLFVSIPACACCLPKMKFPTVLLPTVKAPPTVAMLEISIHDLSSNPSIDVTNHCTTLAVNSNFYFNFYCMPQFFNPLKYIGPLQQKGCKASLKSHPITDHLHPPTKYLACIAPLLIH